MDARQMHALDAALEGCERLKAVFPQDRQLSAVIEQLQAWRKGKILAASRDAVSDRYKRNIDRHIRPLCEEVANLVHQAELQAANH